MEPSPLIAALSQAFVKCCRLATVLQFWTQSAAVLTRVDPKPQIHRQEEAGKLRGLLSPARGRDGCLNAPVLPPVRPVCHFLFYTALS